MGDRLRVARANAAQAQGSQTLSNTVAQGIRVGSWNTKPMSPSDARAAASRCARGRPAEAGDEPERRRLAAARGPEQADELVPADVEIEAGQRRHAVGEDLAPRMPCREPERGRAVRRCSRAKCNRSLAGELFLLQVEPDALVDELEACRPSGSRDPG